MVRFSRVSMRYPAGHEALRRVSFRIGAGEMAFVIGHSGAGKSTLLKLIIALERATEGQLVIAGRNISRLPARRLPAHRRGIGVVFQDHRLLPDRTVFDNVALPLVVSGAGHRDLARRTRAALDKVGLLELERMYPIALSGGEQQRVGIARAVVNRPALLLADEPTGNLDPGLSDQIMDLFRDFNRHGVAVIVATHDQRHVERLGCRVLELRDGELVYDSGPAGP